MKMDGNTPLWSFLGMEAPDLSYVSSDILISYEAEATSLLSSTSKRKQTIASCILNYVNNAQKLPEGEEQQSAARCARFWISRIRRLS